MMKTKFALVVLFPQVQHSIINQKSKRVFGPLFSNCWLPANISTLQSQLKIGCSTDLIQPCCLNNVNCRHKYITCERVHVQQIYAADELGARQPASSAAFITSSSAEAAEN